MNLSETAEVLRSIASLRREGRPLALATIVSVRGSTYRRPGARLLVPETGDPVGNLSGGCLEGEVEQVAREVMESGRARLVMYDLTADDEVVWGWGLGCNGAIEVFVEPADKAAEVADALRLSIEQEREVAVATVLESSTPDVDVGERVLVHADGTKEGHLGSPAADDAVGRLTRQALTTGESTVRDLSSQGVALRAFVEVLKPPLRLLVCGAGHDAIPVVRLASSLGWKTVVVDDRPSMLERTRFPDAAGFVLAEPRAAADAAGVDDRTFAVVMSHNYLRDRSYLQSFLATSIPYIGMLGPRARLERLLEDLRAEGVTTQEDDEARVHGPSGLDVGAEGPEEIAVAIVGEVLAASRGRGGGFLRHRIGPIHERRQPAGSTS
jgi:xanthine/CO dehydrogenase XdhC/CoxF family maturation factor